jgi:RNA polymerase sigma factor (sigma-70 family)
MGTKQADVLRRHLRHLAAEARDSYLSDQQLLERFVTDREAAAFEALVERHGPLVLRVCRRVLADPHAAEDVFQATFLVLVRKAGSIGRRELLTSWLYGVAYRLARRAKVEAAKRLNRESQTAPRSPIEPLAEVTGRELCLVLEEELDRLPERYRGPFRLCYVEGWTRDQVAGQMGWSLRTLHRRLEQGRKLLHARLTRRGVTLSAALIATSVSRPAGAVPARLTAVTLKAALTAAEAAATAGVSVKMVALLVLAFSAVTTGAGLVVHQMLATEPPEAKSENPLPTFPPKTNQPKALMDRHGDPLPPGALARIGTVRFRPGAFVKSVSVSPDGKRAASAGTSVRLWDLVTGKELPTLERQDAIRYPLVVAFAPDGKALATGGYRGIRCWDTTTGKLLDSQPKTEANGEMSALNFSPDSKLIAAGGREGEVELYDAVSGSRIHAQPGPPAQPGQASGIQAVVFSPDGRLLASGGYDKRLALWDVATGRLIRQLGEHEKVINAIAFSPDGKTLASGDGDWTVRLLEVATGREIRRLEGHREMVTCVAFTPDGKTLVSGSGNPLQGARKETALRLWDVATGKPLGELGELTGGLSAVVVTDDGRTLVSAGDGAIRVWDLTRRQEIRRRPGHHSWVATVAYSPDGKILATAGGDHIIRLWDVATTRELRQLKGCEDAVDTVAFSPDGTLLASGSRKGFIRLWDPATGKELRRIKGHEREAVVAFSPDGRSLASASRDGTIALWDVTTGRELRRIVGPKGQGILGLASAPDGKALATAPFDEMRGQLEESPPALVRLWEVATGKALRHFGKNESLGHGVAFSPDGKLLVSAAPENVLRFSDAATGTVRRQLRGHSLGTHFMTFSPDGRTLASVSYDQTVRLWEVATGQERGCFLGHHGGVLAAAFSPDGRTVATGSMDATALIWDLSGGILPGRLPPHAASASDLEALWADLAGADAARAYRAVWKLTATPQPTLAFLRKQLRPEPVITPQTMTQWVRDLDSDRFEVRDQATRKLENLGEAAEAVLRKALAERPSLEVRKRIEGLLDKVDAGAPSPAVLLKLRALEVLEHIGTAEAQEVLKDLAKGMPAARVTQEAKAALERLAKRSAAHR